MRFKEIVSIETIIDTETNIEYRNCLIDEELLDVMNEMAEENLKLREIITEIYLIAKKESLD